MTRPFSSRRQRMSTRFMPPASGLRALGAALCLAAAGVSAQTASQPASDAARASATRSTSLARADRQFIEHAASGGMAEVAMGRMAQQRATDPQVRQFGERMVQDHGKANDELATLARDKGLTLPTGPDRSHRRDSERLGKQNGAAFDRDYMKHMLDDHKKDVADFQRAAKGAKDSAVRDFAARTLPTLQAHLEQARTTYDAVRKTR